MNLCSKVKNFTSYQLEIWYIDVALVTHVIYHFSGDDLDFHDLKFQGFLVQGEMGEYLR